MTLYCFYDLQTCPANYDFFTFAVIAKSEADRLEEECHIVFAPGSTDGFQYPYKKSYSVEVCKFRLNHILFPICYSLCLSYTYLNTREQVDLYEYVEDTIPYNYNPSKPPIKLDRMCSLTHILQQHKKHKLFFPKPTQFAVDLVKKEFPERPIVITLREAEYGQARNSDLEEWLKFARYAEESNNVVFVRDTAKWNDGVMDNRSIKYTDFPLASIDLDVRLALYKHAKLNFSVGGGPTSLLHYSTDIPYRTFKFAVDEHGSSSTAFLESMGFPEGSQFPWSNEDQKLIWKPDTFENLKEEYDLWLS